MSRYVTLFQASNTRGGERVKEQIDLLITELSAHITDIVQKNSIISCSYENEIADKTRALAELITARAQMK